MTRTMPEGLADAITEGRANGDGILPAAPGPASAVPCACGNPDAVMVAWEGPRKGAFHMAPFCAKCETRLAEAKKRLAEREGGLSATAPARAFHELVKDIEAA